MDNCDLEKLAISGQTLQPAFKADVTTYKVTVTSDVDRVTLDLLTSDCGACYKIVSLNKVTFGCEYLFNTIRYPTLCTTHIIVFFMLLQIYTFDIFSVVVMAQSPSD